MADPRNSFANVQNVTILIGHRRQHYNPVRQDSFLSYLSLLPETRLPAQRLEPIYDLNHTDNSIPDTLLITR